MSLDISRFRENNEIITYREKIMTQLLSSDDLAELCKNQEVIGEETEVLMWENFIPMLFVDGTITNTEAYIMYDIILNLNRIKTYNDATIIFQIYCHKDIVRLKNGSGVRIDGISSELNRLFGGKNVLGIGYNYKTSDKVLMTTNTNYVGREIIFKITDFCEVSKNRAKN